MSSGSPDLRYQADETPPWAMTASLGVQLAALNLAAIMLIPTVVMRAAGQPEEYVIWAVLASVGICGVTTVLQAVRYGRIGTGHMLVMGSSGAFIPVCIATLAEHGPGMLATLVVVSCVIPFALSWQLSLFQRILTPAVSGTVIMLIPITVLPIVGDMITVSSDGAPASGRVISAVVTVAVIAGIALTTTRALRLWSPVIGVAAGTLIAAFFGLYDFGRVAGAGWIDIPQGRWPGFDFGPEFWTLLPGFLLAGLIASIRTISGAIAIQRVSWRQSRAVDFRAVQGAMTVDGLASLFSGLTGTVPSTAYSISVSVSELTGVAARAVGVAAGVVFVVLLFFPKAFAAILAIPDAVFAAYLAILLTTLFMVGVRMALQDGLDYARAFIIGTAFLVGVTFQYDLVFPEQVAVFAGGIFRNGMNAGGLTAILLSVFVEMTRPRRLRLEAGLDPSALPAIREFMGRFASRSGWDADMVDRLDAVSEEAVMTLLRQGGEGDSAKDRRLLINAVRDGAGAVLEFMVTPRDGNIQDRLALLGEEQEDASVEQEVSLRLLRQLSSSVRHQQFHDADIVTVRVSAPKG